MYTTIELMETVRSRFSCKSDREIAKILGITGTSVSGYYRGNFASIDIALQIADLLELDPTEVLISNLCENKIKNQRAINILSVLISKEKCSNIEEVTALLAQNKGLKKLQTNEH
ncbi:hypothetical protein ACB087_04070 [Vibrio sp. VNB-15]